jgi:hypothetical protein
MAVKAAARDRRLPERTGSTSRAWRAEFAVAAGPYAERKGISYDAWRAAGLEPRVLHAAGIGRGQ